MMQIPNDLQQHKSSHNEEAKKAANAEEIRLRLSAGCRRAVTKWSNAVIALVYLAAVATLWLIRENVFTIPGDGLIAAITEHALEFGIPAVGLCFFLILLLAFGTPWGAAKIRSNLWRVGLRNRSNEAPLLLGKDKDRYNGIKITKYTLYPVGITLQELMDLQPNIERICHHRWIKQPEEKGAYTILYTVPMSQKAAAHYKDKEF